MSSGEGGSAPERYWVARYWMARSWPGRTSSLQESDGILAHRLPKVNELYYFLGHPAPSSEDKQYVWLAASEVRNQGKAR
jgi:hypothetical protein